MAKTLCDNCWKLVEVRDIVQVGKFDLCDKCCNGIYRIKDELTKLEVDTNKLYGEEEGDGRSFNMEEKIYVEKLPKNCKECYFKQEYYKHSHDKCPNIWCGVGGNMTKEGCPLQLISDHDQEKDKEINELTIKLNVVQWQCENCGLIHLAPYSTTCMCKARVNCMLPLSMCTEQSELGISEEEDVT